MTRLSGCRLPVEGRDHQRHGAVPDIAAEMALVASEDQSVSGRLDDRDRVGLHFFPFL